MPAAKEANPAVALNQHVLATLERCGHLRQLKQLQAHLIVLGHGHTQFFSFKLLRFSATSSSSSSIAAVHAQVAKTGFAGDGVVQTSLLDAYAKCLDVDTARRLFDEMAERNVVSWTAMITGYARAGMIGNATTLFEEMPHRDVPAWNAIIAAYSQNGLFSEAVALFRRMIAAAARPNETTVACVLSACGHLGTLLLAKSIHTYTYRNRIGASVFVSNALIDVYGKCGSLKQARNLFDESSQRSLTLWNSMINCSHSTDTAGRHGVTFVGLLNACAHGGMVDEGRRYFRAMVAGYGVERRIEHYGCMVDLLCRAGRFEEAMEVVEGMRAMEPDEVVWGLCSRLQGLRGGEDGGEGGEEAAGDGPGERRLRRAAGESVQRDGEVGGDGRREEGDEGDGGRKLPGCSWIELESEVHRFYSGDRSHPRAGEIVDALQGLAAFLEY
ncbi:unnamed protein product [Spirodela intermedia]|uniref:Uncharacterized protein n=1 Tax=Spirodela intermedia TaxID=51605 RepID=A0A7I8IX20_SPIIN|nr:unnamed protein product [Spirodela intermedia]CAA6662545.1 unnamed protein product [Spirodela intermedia]